MRDRTVIITGGAGGIGSALVESYLSEGARVGIVDVDGTPLDDARKCWMRHGDRIAFAATDVADHAQTSAAVVDVKGVIGPVDTLILSAGISPKLDGTGARIDELDPADWRASPTHKPCVTCTMAAPARRWRPSAGIAVREHAVGLGLKR